MRTLCIVYVTSISWFEGLLSGEPGFASCPSDSRGVTRVTRAILLARPATESRHTGLYVLLLFLIFYLFLSDQ